MKKIFDSFLAVYQDKGFVHKQKARVLLSIILVLIILTVGFLIKLTLHDTNPIVFKVAGIALPFLFFLLFLLKSGRFWMSGHLLLISMTGIIWSSLFLEKLSIFDRLDGITMVFGLFTLCSLIVSHHRWLIGLYCLLNSIILVVLSLHLQRIYSLSNDVTISMIGDNLLTLFFIAFICYSVLSINLAALKRSQKAAEKAETEAENNVMLNQTLEQKVEQRTRELSKKNQELLLEMENRRKAEQNLKELQQELIDNAHKAGMAEIAANTLHNVGNVLTSLYTSANMIDQTIKHSPNQNLQQANDILRENWSNIIEYISENPKGKTLLEYYLKLETKFQHTFDEIQENTLRTIKKAETISNIITSQQSFTNTFINFSKVNVKDIVEDTLEILPDSFLKQEIKLEKTFHSNPEILVQKSKFIHVLINLIKNAEFALKESENESKHLWIEVESSKDEAIISVRDSGEGIPEENINDVFKHGFTTKKGSFGFGLHSCAIYMEDMKGTIKASSKGKGKGTEFILTLPLNTKLEN